MFSCQYFYQFIRTKIGLAEMPAYSAGVMLSCILEMIAVQFRDDTDLIDSRDPIFIGSRYDSGIEFTLIFVRALPVRFQLVACARYARFHGIFLPPTDKIISLFDNNGRIC